TKAPALLNGGGWGFFYFLFDSRCRSKRLPAFLKGTCDEDRDEESGFGCRLGAFGCSVCLCPSSPARAAGCWVEDAGRGNLRHRIPDVPATGARPGGDHISPVHAARPDDHPASGEGGGCPGA